MLADKRSVRLWIRQIVSEQQLTLGHLVEPAMIQYILAQFGQSSITEQNVRDTFDAARTASE